MATPFQCDNCTIHYNKLKKFATRYSKESQGHFKESQQNSSVYTECLYEIRGCLFMIKHCYHFHTDDDKNQAKRLISIYNEKGNFWKYGTEFVEEKPSECPICLEEFSRDKPLECGHWVCKSCMYKLKKASCPICKQKVTKEKEPPVEPVVVKHTEIPNHGLPIDSFRMKVNEIRMELRRNCDPSLCIQMYYELRRLFSFLTFQERETVRHTMSQYESYFK